MFLDKYKNNLTYRKVAQKVIRHTSSLGYKVFRYLVLIGAAYIIMFPLLRLITSSLTDPYELAAGNSGIIPNKPTFQNFVEFYQYFKFDDYLLKSCQVSLICTVLQLISCALVGYGLGRYKFKGSGLIFAAVLFTIILPTQTATIPQFYHYRWFNLFGIGDLVGLITGKDLTVNLLKNSMAMYVPALFGLGLKSGIFIFLFKQYFASMPKDLEEAAKLDGCGPFATFLRVMVPNIKPVVVTTCLLSVIYYWNDTLTSGVMMMAEEGMTLMVRLEYIFEMNGSGGSWSLNDLAQKTAEECAMTLVCVLPLIILFLIGQRYFVECMDRSGSKG